MEISILSGDNEGERQHLTELLPSQSKVLFNQKPEDKLEFIKKMQQEEKNIMMLGDGLNDAGALAQSNVGVAISENINVCSIIWAWVSTENCSICFYQTNPGP